ncbi:MAG: hypothetical protein RR128_05790 [Clostridium sp.]
MVNIIDAFGEFKSILEKNLNKSPEDKLQLWIEYYEKNYPELKGKCTGDYENGGYNWRDVGTNDFFGDWFQVLGISDAGYFLGSELIKGLSREHDLKHIACMGKGEIEKSVLDFLN